MISNLKKAVVRIGEVWYDPNTDDLYFELETREGTTVKRKSVKGIKSFIKKNRGE